MAIGIRPRYFCTNVSSCVYAREDHPYSQDDHKRGKGACCGLKDDGCGRTLQAGRPVDLRGPLLVATIAGVVGLVLVGKVAYRGFVPAPVDSVSFVATEFRTDDAAKTVALEIQRSQGLRNRATVYFETGDGTARAGQDYEANRGSVVFEPGERGKQVTLTILPERSFESSERYFNVTLTNVVGRPREVVFIQQRKVDQSLQARADQLVRTTSVIAKDIADDVVKSQVLNQLLMQSRNSPTSFHQYQEALQTIQGNLSRARESYVQSFHDLHDIQPSIVMHAMDDVSESLQRQGFEQQHRVILIMKRQFQEYLVNQTLDTDRWVGELSTVIPRVATASGLPST
jgi:hypothetical protein